MIIAVNTRLLLPGRLEGIGWFTYETLERITRLHPEHTFYFIFDRPFSKEFIFASNVKPIICGPQARHPFLFYIWFEWVLPKVLRRIHADLFLSPDGYLSLRSQVPALAVIHDLNFEHHPEGMPRIISWYYKKFFPLFARKAKRIATVSEFSKNDIAGLYRISNDNIDVVYNGVNERYHPVDDEVKRKTREKYSGGRKYFVCVGAILARKNLRNLFLAYDLFRKNSLTDAALLIVGAKMWWTSEMQQTLDSMTFRKDVIFTGRLNADELNDVLASSIALTYVSYFEGFGIPLLEAFRCGVPAISSDVTSMPEVAGDAAILCNPFDPSAIAAAMKKVAEDEILQKTLIEKGHLRLKEFSWDKTAALLWESIMKSLSK